MALKDGDTFNIRHTKSVAEKVKNAKDIIGFTCREFEETEMVYKLLARKDMNHLLIEQYLQTIFPDNPLAESNARIENIRLKVRQLFEFHPANTLPETRGTLWSAYNAVTHFVDHLRSTEKERLNSAWFGSGAKLKEAAFKEALRLAA